MKKSLGIVNNRRTAKRSDSMVTLLKANGRSRQFILTPFLFILPFLLLLLLPLEGVAGPAPVKRVLTLTLSGTGKGSISGNGISATRSCTRSYPEGTRVTLTARAGVNSAFAGWSGCDSSSGNTCQITITADKSVVVAFEGKPHTGVSPASLNFGAIKLDGTATKAVTVKNTGLADLQVSEIQVEGAGSSEYSVTGCDQSVPKGSSCKLQVSFSPTTYGTKTVQAAISSNDPKTPTYLKITGSTASAPSVSVYPSPFEVGMGDSNLPKNQLLVIKNSGSSDLIINSLSYSGDESFAFLNQNCYRPIQKGSACGISVWFNPTTTGLKTGLLSIATNASPAPVTVEINGEWKFKSGLTITAVPGSELVEWPGQMTASDDGNLYIGTQEAIVELSKQGGLKRTLAGNVIDPANFQQLLLDYPFGLHKIGDYVYAGSGNGKIVRVYSGDDGLDAVNSFVYGGVLYGRLNFLRLSGNGTRLFYATDYGIFGKTYNGIDLPEWLLSLALDDRSVIIATEKEIFIKAYSARISNTFDILRFDLATKKVSKIVSGANGPRAPLMTVQGSTLYWLSGNPVSLYGMDINSGQVRLIAGNVGTEDFTTSVHFGGMAAGSEYVYLVSSPGYYPPFPPIFRRVSIASGEVEVLNPATSTIGSLLSLDDKLYFFSGYGPYTLNTFSDTFQPVQLASTKDVPFLGDGADWLLSAGSGKLLLSYGSIMMYDIATGSYELAYPDTACMQSQFYHNGTLYGAYNCGYGGIIGVPVDRKIRQTQVLNADWLSSTQYSSALSIAFDQTYAYWVWRQYSPDMFGISRTQLNGSGSEILFTSTGELRDLNVYNEALYFSCKGTCGSDGWVLASMSLAGGQPAPVVSLLADPFAYLKDGILYVADTHDFWTRTLYAINLAQKKSAVLASGLYSFPYQGMRNVSIDKSGKWLYVGQRDPGGPPQLKISRFPVNGWDSVGKEEVIVLRFGDLNSIFTGSITTDGKYLYYKHNDQIVKVPE